MYTHTCLNSITTHYIAQLSIPSGTTKYLNSVRFGTLSATTANNAVFGITANRKITLHVVSVDSTLSIGGLVRWHFDMCFAYVYLNVLIDISICILHVQILVTSIPTNTYTYTHLYTLLHTHTYTHSKISGITALWFRKLSLPSPQIKTQAANNS